MSAPRRNQRQEAPSRELIGRQASRRWPYVLALLGSIVVCGAGIALGLEWGAWQQRQNVATSRLHPMAASPSASRSPSQDALAGGDPSVRISSLRELPAGPAEHVEVAYFHRTHRCRSCLLAEELTRQALNDLYADQLASGHISFVSEDVQRPADPGLVHRYQAFGSSLYLGIRKGARFFIYPVNEIWFVLGDADQFRSTLRQIIDSVLGGA